MSDSSICGSTEESRSPVNYQINIIETEPVISESNKKHFYLLDKRPRSPLKFKSSITVPIRKMNPDELEIDEEITKKIKTHAEFEDLIADPMVKKFLKK